MSFSSYPYYIYGGLDKIYFVENGGKTSSISYEMLSQLLVNLLMREDQSSEFIKLGLKMQRAQHKHFRAKDLIDPGERPLTKSEVADSLELIVDRLRREVRKDRKIR